jgi:phytoene dehydrogenase-like protein
MDMRNFDAIVVGAGPNGLAAAIMLQRERLSVLLIESSSLAGGGMRTAELTLPGFKHDICSAVHPLAVASPFFNSLPLEQFGLKFIYPEYPAAHPLDDGSAAVVKKSVDETAALLGGDGGVYKQVVGTTVNNWPELSRDILGPLRFPKHPIPYVKFGSNALLPASILAKRFRTPQAKALWAGVAAHLIQPLSGVATAATAMVLLATAHTYGWPVAKGGTASITDALVSYFISLGGTIKTGFHVNDFEQLPPAKAVLFDLTPSQVLKIMGDRFSSFYRLQLRRFKYGAGVFKVDWALSEPIPFRSAEAKKAGTVHLGNTIEEIMSYEKEIHRGKIGDKPFVLLSQPSVFDGSRAPKGRHTAWAYCHVPSGSVENMTEKIERQVERFAPGFRDVILARHTFNTQQLQEYNNNYVGGDINGGAFTIGQMFTRPTISATPYRTSRNGIYICSSSTPPGGGVHGMCGYHAARIALKDVFGIQPKQL